MKILVAIALLLTATLHAADARITWDPPTNAVNVAGYEVHAGMASREYTQHSAWAVAGTRDERQRCLSCDLSRW